MQLQVSEEVNATLESAAAISVRQGSFFVGVEHLLAALLDDPDDLPQVVRDDYLNTLFAVLREVDRCAWREPVASPRADIFHTPRVISVIQQAGKYAGRHGAATTQGHLLLALFADAYSAPSRAMDALSLDRGELIAVLRRALGQPAAPAKAAQEPAKPQSTVASVPVPAEGTREKGVVQDLTRDLTAAANAGRIETAVGRDQEIFEILQILARKTKNNAIVVGEAGVGKTQVVEGLALWLAKGRTDESVPKYRILELNIASLMTGTQYRGAFEEKVMALLDDLRSRKDTVLFIDEIHLIMGAGSTDGDSMDLANLLKPVLARGEIRCIGATTLQEYRKFVAKDPAIERRFQMVRLGELSEEATMEVLKRLRPSLEGHHKVRISGRALQASVALTQRYMPNRRLPDKAIDVLDQACARYRLKALAAKSDPGLLKKTLKPRADERVTPHDIRKVVSQITAVPIEEMTAEDRKHLRQVEKRLTEHLVGQDEAVSRVVSAIKKSRTGLSDPHRPDAVLLFLGPTGVGKTQLAKLLAAQLFGSKNHLITFDMSEYIEEHAVSRLLGAPPGYVGHEEDGRLIAAVRDNPFSVLLFDEIEKAHPRIFDVFLPIFEEGRLKDGRGAEVVFRNCIIILTSNVGAESLGRGDGDDDRDRLMLELRRHFRPEFINRLDEIVPFHPLLAEDIRSILRLEVNAVRARLKDKKVGIRMYQRAYEHLASIARCDEFGARELRRVVDKHVTAPVSELLLQTDALQPGDMVDVLMEDGKLVARRGAPRREAKEAAS